MRRLLTLLFTIIVVITSFAQQGINYKAVIKDDKGNVINIQKITVQFGILHGENKSNIYSETHTPTTDANGTIMLNIGKGNTLNGDFSQIKWGNAEHYLHTQIDTGNGLKDVGITTFNAVPYAYQAQTAAKAMNVTGLEAIDEGNGIGWRFVGKDPAYYGAIGTGATDLSTSFSNSNFFGATGYGSLASGLETLASGDFSTALGYSAIATGYWAAAIGFNVSASGNASSAFGRQTRAPSYGEMALGILNTTYTPSSASDWVGSDRLFTIGNGDTTRSDALIILKNGSITAPSLDLGEITDNKSLTTKEYVDLHSGTGSGLEAIDEGNGIGWRLIGTDPNLYGNVGFQAVDVSNVAHSTQGGALGYSSFTSGYQTTASGSQSTAIGSDSYAIGNNSTALGTSTFASGNRSMAIGNQVIARSYSEMVLGINNKDYTPNSTSTFNSSDRLVVVGNGTSGLNKSNALTIYKNGNVALGNITPSSSTTENVLDVSGRVSLRPKTGSGSTSGIWYTDVGGTKRQFAGAKQHSFLNSARQWGVYIQGWKFWVNGNGDATLTGSLAQNSDKRLKKEITDLSYGLTEILQLQPKQYFWKDRENQEEASLGLIAQEVQKIISNVVHTGADDKKTLSLSYTELIPVLINAIKEQQQIIDNQTKKLDTQDSNYANLLKRLETLEAHNTQDKNITKATLITHKNKK